jgi:N-acetylmuramoyl-L-alanine amidase
MAGLFVRGQETAPPAKPEVATPPAPVRAAPTRPVKLWSFVRLRGVDYVSLRDVAERFDLKLAWTKSSFTQTLSDARGVRLNFENNQHDFFLDGVRIFLADPVLLEKDTLWISKIDLIKLVAPLIRPSDYSTHLPAAALRTIVIDPGHGGTDPGKQNARLKLDEKDLTLDVSLRLKKLLETLGYRVVLTRTTDKRFSNNPIVDLPLRAEVANKESADLFISIHFNAVDRDLDRVSGTETYVLTPQFQISTQPEQDRSMVKEFYPGNQQDAANALLGYSLHRQLITDLKGSDRGYKHRRLAVLRTLKCPGVLVEAAYLSNDTEARRLATPEFRQKIAGALADGIQDYAATLATMRPSTALAR